MSDDDLQFCAVVSSIGMILLGFVLIVIGGVS